MTLQYTLSTSSQTNAGEVSKSIRQNIYSTEQQYLPKKIKAKSEKVYLTFAEDNDWKDTLERRTEHRSCGFFANIESPYTECGKVQLNNKNLVIESLQRVGNQFYEKAFDKKLNKSEKEVEVHHEEKKSLNLKKIEKRKIVLVEKERDNGIYYIEELLGKARKRITSVKAGQSLYAYLEREKHEKEQKMLNNKEQTDNALDMILLGHPLDHSSGIDDSVSTKDIRKHFPTEMRSTSHRQKYFITKLNYLVVIFNSIQNMKLKDLRGKVPLSLEALQSLRRTPTHDVMYNNRQTRNSFIIQLPPDKLRHYVGDTNKPLPTLQESISHHSDNTPAAKKKQTSNNLHCKMKLCPNSTSGGLDTCEDLLNIETHRGGAGVFISPLDNDHHSALAQSRFNISVKSQQKKRPQPNDVLPPWQKVVFENKDGNEKEKQAVLKKSGRIATEKSQKHEEILEGLIANFEETKLSCSTKMQQVLNERIDAYEQQLQYLKLHMLRERDMKNMRCKVNEWRQKILKGIAKEAQWLETLRSEQSELRLAEDDVTNSKLSYLARCSEAKLPQHADAKLCLLVLSLPAYDVCTLEMQEALKYFLADILELPAKRLREWLRIRKLNIAS